MGNDKINVRDLDMAHTVSEVCDSYRTDGYQNMLTKYGTKQDSSTAFQFVPEAQSDDYTLGINYQFNGLFAKIIDLPAGEAISKGFKLNINNADVEAEIMKKWAKLGGEEAFETAVKWSRLYGGAIAVMLIYDGRGIDEPLNYKAIRGIDEIRVFEAAVVNPIFTAGYYSGEPEYYQINSLDGSFTVHASRCLLFRNGRLPQQVVDSKQRVFGFAEYDRIKTALRETVTSHGYAPRMLERAIQSIIKIKDLAGLLSTSDGEDVVVKRLQLIDMARSMFNSIAVDAEGEDFDFKSAPYTGVREILDSSCNMLSAVTNIPQALLFGSSPQGMDATGHSDLENYYNYVQQIQKRMLKAPLERLFGIIIKALAATGRIDDNYDFELEFNPLWSLSESEQATVDQARAQVKLIKAQTAQMYIDMQALDPQEVRAALAKADEYDVETILDDIPDDELFASMIDESSDEAPPADTTQIPKEEVPQQEDSTDEATAAAVLVVNSEGKVLCGVRSDNNLVCGPGGHIEQGERPIQAAIREAQEEFGITPTSLMPFATIGENNALQHKTDVFLCTSFTGTPKCDEKEMHSAMFLPLNTLLEFFGDKLFAPFKESLECIRNDDWITMNGTHVEVSEKGAITKGPENIKRYSACKISKKSPKDISAANSGITAVGLTSEQKETMTGEEIREYHDAERSRVEKERKKKYPDKVRSYKHYTKAEIEKMTPSKRNQLVRKLAIWSQVYGRSSEFSSVTDTPEHVVDSLLASNKFRSKTGQVKDFMAFQKDYENYQKMHKNNSDDENFDDTDGLNWELQIKDFFNVNNSETSEADDFMNSQKTASKIQFSHIAKENKSAIIKSQDISEVNADFGVKGMKWGEHKAVDRSALQKRLVGKKTADGVEIKKVSNHAFDRVDGRNISEQTINELINTQITSPGNTERTRCYEIKKYRMILDIKSGIVVTVMKRRNNK